MMYCPSNKRLAQSLYECGIKAELGIIKEKRVSLPRHYFRLTALLGDHTA